MPYRAKPSTMPPESKLVGAMIGDKYRVRRVLGIGGMGTVYKAENVAIGRTVAVKLLHSHLTDDSVTLARFQREARAAASVCHPHVVEILDMGLQRNGAPYIVMEYVRGKSLAKALRAEGPFAPERAAKIAGQVLDALDAMHSRGIVHRDLKPENVLLTARGGRDDYVKVFDFGIATFLDAVADASGERDLTPSGRTMGTPLYSSPEQIEGAKTRDARMDLYSVGVLLFEMLTGQRLFQADNLADLARQILRDDPPPLRVYRQDVPHVMEAVMRRALAKKPADRFQTAAELLEALVPLGARSAAMDEPEPTDTFTVDLRELRAREQILRAGSERPSFAIQDSRLSQNMGGLAAAQARMRGTLVAALAEFLCARVGEAAWHKLVGSLEPTAGDSLRGEIEPSRWYPDTVMDVLEAADEQYNKGDKKLVADAGCFCAQRTVPKEPHLRSATPELLFSMAADLWRRYFGGSEATVVKVGKGYGRLEVRGDAAPRLSRSVVAMGYLSEALRMAGARDVDVRLVRSLALGDNADVFEATWSS